MSLGCNLNNYGLRLIVAYGPLQYYAAAHVRTSMPTGLEMDQSIHVACEKNPRPASSNTTTAALTSHISAHLRNPGTVKQASP